MTSIFTKIYKGEIPGEFLYKDDEVFVIKDINPKAKHHYLIIPVKEIETINKLEIEDKDLLFKMFEIAKKIALEKNIIEGYQLHFNVGKKGGQEVMHIHLHLLSDL